MDKWISNLKMSVKLLLSPMLVLIFLVAFGIVGYWGLRSQQNALDSIYNEHFNLVVETDNNTQAMAEAGGNVHKYITWARANYTQARLDELSHQQVETIEKTSKSLKDLSQSALSDEMKKKYEEAFKEVEDYKKSVTNFFDLASFDLNTATMAMSTVEEKYTILSNTLMEIKKINLAESFESYESANSNYSLVITVFLIFILSSITLSLLATFKINSSIAKPVEELKDAAKKVSNGDFNIALSINSSDEIGQLASGFQTMVENIKTADDQLKYEKKNVEIKVEEAIREIEDQKKYLSMSVNKIVDEMERFAEGDLTVSLLVEKDDEIGKLFNGFNKAVGNVGNLITQVTEAVQATASASGEISSSSEEMAAGAQEQSAQSTEVAGAVEQMAKTIMQTTSNVNVASGLSKEANQQAKVGVGKVEENKKGIVKIINSAQKTGKIIGSLAGKTDQIGDIAQVIDDIADQTNLLALNAAIEAARAGEQGRGFAVVADEVRKLAERTTKATKEIAETIKSIQKEAKEADLSMIEAGEVVMLGQKLTDEVEQSLYSILQSTEKVSAEIEQVAAASEEQSSAAEEISKNIEAISSVTHQSAAGVQQIARAAEDLNRLTDNLQNLVSQFKTNISTGNRLQRRIA